MLLGHADESYTADFYYIAALLTPDREAVSLTRALDAVVGKAAAAYGVDPMAELHAQELFRGSKDWATMAGMTRARIGVFGAAFQALADHDVAVIVRGVDIRRLNDRYAGQRAPHVVTLQHLLERIHDHAEHCDEYSLVIADEVGMQHQHRADLRQYQLFGTPGYRGRRLDRIVDTLHFAPSRDSRLLQAADLIAFLYRRRTTHVEPDARAVRANDQLWALIAPKVVHDWTWRP